jgi:predicted metal-dependent phosphoesterase TrpH
VLAITDHDTTVGVPAALEAARRYGITVVPGVEISTLSGREEIHLLGYFVDLDDADLQALLVHTRQRRRERAEQMLIRLAQLGLPLELDRVLAHAGQDRSVGRAHVAMALLEAGHVSSFDEAFNLWIGRDCPAYVERLKISPEDAIQLVRKSGGIPVLAHPYTYTRSGEFKTGLDLKRWLPRLWAAGLMGIEAYYPHYPHRITRRLLMLAIRYGLLIAGGSDFHGTIAAGNRIANGLGSVAVPYIVWEGLERRHDCHGQSLGEVEPDHSMHGRWRDRVPPVPHADCPANRGGPDSGGLRAERPDCRGQSSFASSQV